MSSKKEPDIVGFWQNHNRNVALAKTAEAQQEAAKAKKEIAEAAKEQALQAKLDREANDRHRAEMKEIARQEKEANERHRAEMRELARQEKEAKEFTKQQQFKLFDLSCRIEELDKQDTILSRIRLYNLLCAEYNMIVHDAIEDLKYRKLYLQVQTSLKKEQDYLSANYKRELSLYLLYSDLKTEVESYANTKEIKTFEEMHLAEELLSKTRHLSEEMSELSLKTDSIQENIAAFQGKIAKLKWFLDSLDNYKIAPTHQRIVLLFSFWGLNESLILSKDWKHVKPIAFSVDDLTLFCCYCVDYVHQNQDYLKTVLEILGSIAAPEAEQTIQIIEAEQEKKRVEEMLRKQQEEQEKLEKQKREQEEIEKKRKAEIQTKRGCGGCCGCLGLILIFAGFSYLGENKKIQAVVLFVVAVLFVLGSVEAFIQANQKNKKQ